MIVSWTHSRTPHYLELILGIDGLSASRKKRYRESGLVLDLISPSSPSKVEKHGSVLNAEERHVNVGILLDIPCPCLLMVPLMFLWQCLKGRKVLLQQIRLCLAHSNHFPF